MMKKFMKKSLKMILNKKMKIKVKMLKKNKYK